MRNRIRETNIFGEGTRQFSRNAMDCPALKEVGIDSIGFGEMGRGYYSGRIKPAFSHMASCIAGIGEVYSGGSWMSWRPGMNVFQPAKFAHAARSIEGKTFSFFWILINRDSALLRSKVFLKPCQIERDSIAVAGAVRELCCEGMGRKKVSADFEKACAQLIYSWLEALVSTEGPSGRLDPLWQEVEMHLENKWNALSLAKIAGVCPTHLRRLCANEEGISPMHKLTLMRVERAKTLMSVMNMKMEEVAQKVGYANMFAFSAAFKRCAGISPSNWRAKARKTV